VGSGFAQIVFNASRTWLSVSRDSVRLGPCVALGVCAQQKEATVQRARNVTSAQRYPKGLITRGKRRHNRQRHHNRQHGGGSGAIARVAGRRAMALLRRRTLASHRGRCESNFALHDGLVTTPHRCTTPNRQRPRRAAQLQVSACIFPTECGCTRALRKTRQSRTSLDVDVYATLSILERMDS